VVLPLVPLLLVVPLAPLPLLVPLVPFVLKAVVTTPTRLDIELNLFSNCLLGNQKYPLLLLLLHDFVKRENAG
jgi:hypothetical protein